MNKVSVLETQIKALRRKLTELEGQVEFRDKKAWANVSKQITMKPDYDRGRITHFSFYYRCWCIGSLWLDEFPEFRQNNQHFKIEWVDDGKIKVLWDGELS